MKFKKGQTVRIKPYSGLFSIAQEKSGQFDTATVIEQPHTLVRIRFINGQEELVTPGKLEVVE